MKGINMSHIGKTDPVLGQKVENHLISLGLQTPTTDKLKLDDAYKLEEIEFHTKSIWEILGLNMNDDSLADTPRRIAKMFVKEIYWGLSPDNFPKITTIDNKMKYNEMLVEKDIAVMSQCEHHGVVIDGKASVAYIPKNKVIGLSKINRVVNYFSRRPQVQERLTAQIFETMKFILDTEDVAVVIDATHYCVKSRGIQDQSSHTSTSALGGVFKEGPVRSEFMSLAR
jgi:GTP cyclohydrolase I